MRFLLAPLEVAGFMGRLRDGLRSLGHEAKLADFGDSYMRYTEGDDFRSTAFLRSVRRWCEGKPAILRYVLVLPLSAIARLAVFLHAVRWPDVLVFCFAQTLLGGVDLPWYRFFGKRVVLVYLGSDSRPLYLNGSVITESRGISLRECARRVRSQKRRIVRLDRHADLIIDHAPAGQFHERPFVPFLFLGVPAPAVEGAVPAPMDDEEVRILHAPTFPEAKGTAKIRQAVATLAKLGKRAALVEVMGKKNSEVIEEIKKCSFVLDELYSDSVLAGLGTEAAMLGKATVVGGYAADEDFGVPAECIPPAIRTRPELLVETLAEVIDSKRYRKVGASALSFVRDRLGQKAVASRFMKLLEDGSGLGMVDPAGIRYFHGWGFPKEAHKKYLGDFIGKFGIEALCLDDKPELRRLMLDFAGVDQNG